MAFQSKAVIFKPLQHRSRDFAVYFILPEHFIQRGAIHVDDNVFKFVHWNSMYAARNHMLNMRWLFYNPSGL
uniref:Uncharacterized protein n=1 Tax=Heterorhabditis bacteriophora TaxID=37862 RepID=A0A1I7XRP6_HETBA